MSTYPRYVVDPKHDRVFTPGGRAGESYRSGGSRDGRVRRWDKERVDVECAG